MKHWTEKYLGIPHRDHGVSGLGCNCWGLVCLVYAAELDIALPTYDDRFVGLSEQAEIDALVQGEKDAPRWRQVTEATAQAFDVALFRQGRFETHVGIVVSAGVMLHVCAAEQAKIQHYTGIWQHRLKGIYRHVERASK